MKTAPGSEENAEITGSKDSAIQHDLAPGDLEFAVDAPQPVASIPDEERLFCFETGLVDDEVRLHLVLVQARTSLDLDVGDEVARPRGRVLGPGHPGSEPGHADLKHREIVVEVGHLVRS